jgi:hypothetical protein
MLLCNNAQTPRVHVIKIGKQEESLTGLYFSGKILQYNYCNIGGDQMASLAWLIAKRVEIIDEISAIESMRKGVLNSKYQKVKLKNGDVADRGPYYVLTKKSAGGKTVSKSVTPEDAPRIQEEVDKYKRFRQLSDEYVDVCEEISMHMHSKSSDDEVKKN